MNPARIVLQRIIQLKLNLFKIAKFRNKTYCEREEMLSSHGSVKRWQMG